MSAVSCLMERSRGARLSLSPLADERIRKNVIEDLFFSYQLNLDSDSYSLSKNHQFIFMQAEGLASLYSLVVRKVLWQCSYKLQDGHKVSRVKVFNNGVGVIISKPRRFRCHDKTLLIFSQGNWTGTIPTHDKMVDAASFNSVDNLLFVMSNDRENIHVWDIEGKKWGDIPTEGIGLEYEDKPIVTCNENFSVWVVKSKIESSMSSKMFVLNLVTYKKNVYAIRPNFDDVSIHVMKVFKNTLICGANRIKKKEPFRGFESLVNPRIVEVNMITGEVEKCHILQKTEGEVKTLAVTDNFISCFASPYFCIIDKKSNLITRILQVAHDLSSTRFHFSFSGDLFYACCLRYQCKAEDLINVLYVYDCSNSKFVKKKYYKSFPSYSSASISFQSGKLVMLGKGKVYIEDFEETHGVEEKKASSSVFSIVSECFRDS